MTKDTIKTYTVQAICNNCGHAERVEVPMGQKREGVRKCQNCGCLTLYYFVIRPYA